MECKICNYVTDDGHFIYETIHWKIYLAPIQSYLGRCEVEAKYHYNDLAQINQEVWVDFTKVIYSLENSLKKAFDATMFNWTCLMNNAYQNTPPHPHVHWHFTPRYNHEVKIDQHTFRDLEFGHHYNPLLIEDDDARIERAPLDLKKTIIKKIKENLP